MKVVDANVLLYAISEDATHHERARRWLDGTLTRGDPVGFTWLVVTAFLRLATNPAVLPEPLSVGVACDVMERWLRQPAATVLEPTSRHVGLVRGLLEPLGAGGNLVADAHLAAVALEHAAEVVSFDNDFSRFTGVRWSSPPPV